MSLDQIAFFIQSSTFKLIASAFALLSLVLAAVLVALFVQEYFLTRDAYKEGRNSEPWPILMSTFRDSFLLTGLYIAIDFFRGGLQFRGATETPTDLIGFLSLISPFIETFVFCMMTFIVIRRVVILRNWLAANVKK